MSPTQATDPLPKTEYLANLSGMQSDNGSTALKKSAQLEEEDSSVQVKVSSLDADDDAPRTACDRIASQIAVNRSVTAPLHRLPPELLAEIFLNLHNYPYSTSELSTLDRSIARVCITWRQVALGTPRLWAFIVVQPKTINAEEYLRRYLPRSKSCPLYILCDTAGQPGLLPLLSEHASRWHTLSLRTCCADSRAMTPVATPLLQCARVIVSDMLDAEHSGLLGFLRHTPKLRDLVVRGCGIEAAAKLTVPASRVLVTLDLAFHKPYSLASILTSIQQYSKTLKELRLSLAGDAVDASSVGRTITLPALRSLCVVRKGLSVLPRISTPSLYMLCVDTRPATFPSVFLDFLERASLNICMLDLLFDGRVSSAVEADTAMLLRCMTRMKGLEQMRIRRCPAFEAFLTGLAWKEDAPVILPNLKMVAMLQDKDAPQSPSVFEELCRSRRMSTASRGPYVIGTVEGMRLETVMRDLRL